MRSTSTRSSSTTRGGERALEVLQPWRYGARREHRVRAAGGRLVGARGPKETLTPSACSIHGRAHAAVIGPTGGGKKHLPSDGEFHDVVPPAVSSIVRWPLQPNHRYSHGPRLNVRISQSVTDGPARGVARARKDRVTRRRSRVASCLQRAADDQSKQLADSASGLSKLGASKWAEGRARSLA